MSDLEDALAFQIRAVGLPEPVREFRFAPPRRYRADFAYPAYKLLVEVEGGVWSSGRHVRGAGYIADCEKYNAATLAGFRLLRVTAEHVRDGRAVAWIEQAIGSRGD